MRLKLALLAVAVCIAAAVAGALALRATAGQPPLEQARAATAGAHTGVPAGYGLFTDAAGIACIEMPPMPGMPAGAMGIHYVNGDLVGDHTVDPAHPEAVIYEPEKNGQLRLVGLEYVTIKADWDAYHSSPPTLFGQPFNVTPSPNRYGLPPFYSLHAWIWKNNPEGMFAMWNPDVSCANA